MSKKPKISRQAAYDRRKVAQRRQAGLCIRCRQPSETYFCKTCRPSKVKSPGELSAIRSAAASKRWGKQP